MSKRTRLMGAAALLVVTLGGCVGMPKKPENPVRGDYSYVREHISWLARKEMKKHDVTGLSIALVDDQKVVWAEGFGYADEANEVPAAPETIYRAGSVSKLFTATAAMQLAEQGKLELDQPLQSYLPEFSVKSRFPEAAPVTPRSLMTHHSGLPSDIGKGMWTRNPEPFQNEVNLLREQYAANPPNYVFSYSNLGVTLLGHALEKVSGRDFAGQMEAALLKPLGMDSSRFSTAPDRSPLGSKAYQNGKEAEEPSLRSVPAGGLNTTVLDLSRFMQMVFAGGRAGERQIVSPETLAEMLRPQNADVPLDLNFRIGLGWMLSGVGDIDIRNAGPIAHHSGGTPYHRSLLIVLPEQKLGVVVLSNSPAAGAIVGKVAGEALKLALEAKAGIKQPEPTTPAAREASPAQEELLEYQGRYATVAGVVPVVRKSDYLQAEVMGKALRLVPRADGQLGLQYRLLGLIPISLGPLDRIGISRATVAGRDILKARLGEQELLVGERILTGPIPEKWLQRTGEYEIVNMGEDAMRIEEVRVRHDDGLLMVEYTLPRNFGGTASFALMPLSDSEARIAGLGRGMGETIRVVTVDGEELFSYAGYLLRKKGE